MSYTDPSKSVRTPHEGLRDSYRALVQEFINAGEALVPFPFAFPNDDLPAFLARLVAGAKGEASHANRFTSPLVRTPSGLRGLPDTFVH